MELWTCTSGHLIAGTALTHDNKVLYVPNVNFPHFLLPKHFWSASDLVQAIKHVMPVYNHRGWLEKEKKKKKL